LQTIHKVSIAPKTSYSHVHSNSPSFTVNICSTVQWIHSISHTAGPSQPHYIVYQSQTTNEPLQIT
jgi:hypothetical protein